MPPMIHAPVAPGYRPMPTTSGTTMTFQDVLRILKKRLFLIIGVFIGFFIFTLVGTFVWKQWYPSYSAFGLVEVRSPVTPKPLSGSDTATIPAKDIIEQYINTQAQMISSQATLQKALADPYLQQTSWYKSFGTGTNVDTNAAMIDLQERLIASPIRDTWFVRVGFSWKDAEEAATVTNVILDTYYQDARGASQEKTRNELDQYQSRADELRQDLRKKLEEQERFRATNKIPLIEQRRANIGDQVAVLTQLLAEGMTNKDQAQALYEMYNQPGAMERMADTPEMRQMVENDPIVRYYTSQLVDLRITLQSAKDRGGKNRNVKEVESRIKMVEKELNDKKREVMSDTYRDMRERTRVQLDTVNTQIIGIQNRLAEAKGELAELEMQLAKYLATDQEIEALRKNLEEVEKYILTLRIKLSDTEMVRVNIAARAVRPLERSSPKLLVNIPAGFVLGWLLGIGLAFLLEFMSTTVKTPADVLRQLNMPLLGQIPSQDDDDASASDMQRLLLESPHSILAESFRQLRANLLFCAPAEQQRSILITSCSPTEGKTCIAVNLATSLAMAGRKVLLVDANFRRPAVAQSFAIQDAPEGFSNILIGHNDPEKLIHRTQLTNLDIISSGPLPPNPSELLSGNYLKGFIDRFSTKYETILFDGPPVLVVSDAMVLSTKVDGVMLVVRAGISSRGAIQRAKDQLRRASAKFLGVVLDDVKITRGGYFREMYKTYYEYQSPAALSAAEAETENGSNTAK